MINDGSGFSHVVRERESEIDRDSDKDTGREESEGKKDTSDKHEQWQDPDRWIHEVMAGIDSMRICSHNKSLGFYFL